MGGRNGSADFLQAALNVFGTTAVVLNVVLNKEGAQSVGQFLAAVEIKREIPEERQHALGDGSLRWKYCKVYVAPSIFY